MNTDELIKRVKDKISQALEREDEFDEEGKVTKRGVENHHLAAFGRFLISLKELEDKDKPQETVSNVVEFPVIPDALRK